MAAPTRELGVKGQTVNPVGQGPIQAAAMNRINVIGRFPRQFQNPQVMEGELDRDFIIGPEPQSGKMSWYVFDRALQNARPYPIRSNIVCFDGSGSVQASANVNDSQATMEVIFSLHAAYKNNDSKGAYDNNFGYLVEQLVNQTTAMASNTAGGDATSLTLNSAQKIVVGEILRVTRGVTTYGFKVATVNYNTNVVTGTSDSGAPQFLAGDVVEAMRFTLTAYRKDFQGIEHKVNTSFNSIALSMESENADFYLPTVFQNHPLYRGQAVADVTPSWLNRVPSTMAAPAYLSGGADGAAPATVADWTNLQADFDDDQGTYAVWSCESTDDDVAVSYEAWCAGLRDHPRFYQAIQNFLDDYTALYNWGLKFKKASGWVQMLNAYGWRYVTDPVSSTGGVIQIPWIGDLMGLEIKVIYSGKVHRAPAETQFQTLPDTPGPQVIYEDAWNDTVRTLLYTAGINIVQNRSNFGLNVRNWITPSDDVLTRDGHIHAINQLIKFTEVQNFQTAENVPNQFQYLLKVKERIEKELLRPMFEGNFFPFCMDRETGAFRKTKADGTPAEWFDVSACIADAFNNPSAAFADGDGNIDTVWVPYSLLRSLYFSVTTTVQIFN